MKIALLFAGVALIGLMLSFADEGAGQAAESAGPMIVHDVYFTLKDPSKEAQQKLVDSCKKCLDKHPGTVFFAAGTLAEGLDRPVNDREFHVGLHVIFKTRADHDRYQTDERHLKFIEENKDNWAKVRVFDTQASE